MMVFTLWCLGTGPSLQVTLIMAEGLEWDVSLFGHPPHHISMFFFFLPFLFLVYNF
jgi:hypothetical protein